MDSGVNDEDDDAGGGPGRSTGDGAAGGAAADGSTVASGEAQTSRPVGCRAQLLDPAQSGGSEERGAGAPS